MFGFVARTALVFKNPSTYMYLYYSLIRPNIEYAILVWDPYYKIYKSQLEKIQKKFLKMTSYRCYGGNNYIDKLINDFKFLPLEKRRIKLESVFLYKLLNDHIGCSELLEKINFRVPSIVTRSKALFSLKTCRTNAGHRSPLYRMCLRHNKLFSDIDIFSLSLGKYRKDIVEALCSKLVVNTNVEL